METNLNIMTFRRTIISVVSGVIILSIIATFYMYRQTFVTSSQLQSEKVVPIARYETAYQPQDDVVNQIRVICLVVTYPPKHNTSARSVKETWGKRCTRLVFISTQREPDLPTFAVAMQEDRNHLWGKTKLGLQYLYKRHYKEGDWFLKADDDTYVVMENLKLVLSQYSPDMPVHLGCQYNKFTPQGYMSGGAGYVLSREALRRAVEEGFNNKTMCKQEDTGAEDAEIGKCLYRLGVKNVDSRDAQGRHRFFPFSLEYYTHGHIAEYWFWDNIYYPFNEGDNCCSSTPISWHYVKHKMMYVLEYLVYNARPYGRPSPIQDVRKQVLPKS